MPKLLLFGFIFILGGTVPILETTAIQRHEDYPADYGFTDLEYLQIHLQIMCLDKGDDVACNHPDMP